MRQDEQDSRAQMSVVLRKTRVKQAAEQNNPADNGTLKTPIDCAKFLKWGFRGARRIHCIK